MDEPQTAPQTDEPPAVTLAPWRAECLPPEMIRTLLSLLCNKSLTDYAKNIEDLHAVVNELLLNPCLQRGPLTVTLITLELGEAVLPYVLVTLANQIGSLPTDVRESLRGHTRQAETFLTRHSHQIRETFTLDGGEVVHTRYYNLLANLRGVTDLLDRWR